MADQVPIDSKRRAGLLNQLAEKEKAKELIDSGLGRGSLAGIGKWAQRSKRSQS